MARVAPEKRLDHRLPSVHLVDVIEVKMKTCTKCGEAKPLAEYYARQGKPLAQCKSCMRASCKSWYSKNREHQIAKASAWQSSNIGRVLEKNRAWRQVNPDKAKEAQAKYHKANPVGHRDRVARRRAAQKNAVPKWADRVQIKFLYATRYYMSLETGIEWHVDHFVPLQHDKVCGLHTPANLRIIPATDNRRKHNKFSLTH